MKSVIPIQQNFASLFSLDNDFLSPPAIFINSEYCNTCRFVGYMLNCSIPSQCFQSLLLLLLLPLLLHKRLVTFCLQIGQIGQIQGSKINQKNTEKQVRQQSLLPLIH